MHPNLEAYLGEARSWDLDRERYEARAARRAWVVAAVAVMVAVLALVAVLCLTPLKTVEPFVVRVDSATGVVDVLPRYAGTPEVSELVTRYLLSTYVTARERYVYALAESDYDTVGSFNSAALNQLWSAAWDRNNPASPLNLYKDGTSVRVQVKSISFLHRADGTQDLAQVRFLTATRTGGVGQEQLKYWIATLQYLYVPPSKDDRQRALNPLGLRILEYRREAEVADDTPIVSAAGGRP